LKVIANCLGYPKPRISVLLNDQPIGDAIITELDGGDQQIQIRKLNRSHSGRIWLRAVNSLGEDSVCVDLKVLDVPPAPTNLRAKNVTSQSVDLAWNMSTDSRRGEENIESFIIERKTADR
jgi:hypothetical protein